MRGKKGFSLVELLAVAVIIALIMILVTLAVVGHIDEARASTLGAQARMVYIIANTVILETQGEDISDEDYMAGLSGDTGNLPWDVRVRISERMKALLAPDVILSDGLEDGTARVSFTVEDGSITAMRYEAMVGSRQYAVTIANGETVVERVREPGAATDSGLSPG